MILSSNYLQVAMNEIEENISEQLKKCCKDEDSFLKLKNIFSALKEKNSELEEQLELLDLAIRQDYDSIMITDLNLNEGPFIKYVNSGFTKMTGYSKNEVMGKTPDILYGPKTARDVIEQMNNRLKKGHSFWGHTVNYRKDGTEFINQWDIHPLMNEDGEVSSLIAYQRDVSKRSEASGFINEKQSSEEDLKLHQLSIYVDLNSNGLIVDANRLFKQITGFDLGELKGRPIWEMVTEDDRDEVQYLFSDFDGNGMGEQQFNWEFLTKEGEPTVLEANITSFRDNDNLRVRVYFQNLSMKNKIIEVLNKKRKKINHLLSNKDEFRLRFIKNEKGEMVCKYISDSVENITGYNPDVILEKGWKKIITEEDVKDTQNALRQAFKGETSTIRCRYRTKNGSEIPVLQSFQPDQTKSSGEVKVVHSVVLKINPDQ